MSDELPFVTRLKSDDPVVMGVVNVTPDSFSDGGEFYNADKAIAHGLQMIADGAEVLDVGGESSRPGAEVIDIDEEIARVVPVIEGLRGQSKYISIDTRNAKTMRAALDAGANIINDISALTHDPESVSIAAAADVPVILMHMQGTPQTMQDNPIYNNVVEDVFGWLKGRIQYCETHRLPMKNVVLDPGLGFGKTLEDNLLILRNITKFSDLECPILLGSSRKSFIAKVSNDEPPEQRLAGSLSSVLWGLSQGVNFFRVHDVPETIQAIKVYRAIADAKSDS